MRTVFLACYAPQAVKGLIEGSDRKAAINALLESVGGKLESLMFTRGEYDIAAIADLPDQSTGMGLTMAIQASGAFTKISILEELDMSEVIPAAQKAAKVYQPAG
ncbi:MAG: GYD domain-containing protein [Hyphomicrobiales bacterium]